MSTKNYYLFYVLSFIVQRNRKLPKIFIFPNPNPFSIIFKKLYVYSGANKGFPKGWEVKFYKYDYFS